MIFSAFSSAKTSDRRKSCLCNHRKLAKHTKHFRLVQNVFYTGKELLTFQKLFILHFLGQRSPIEENVVLVIIKRLLNTLNT